MTNQELKQGFTLIELLVVIAIIGVLTGLLLPAVQQAREAARRLSCTNNQKQIGLAIHNYANSQQQFPTGVGFTTEQSGCLPGTGTYLWTFRILPFLEQATLAEMISPSSSNGGGGGAKTLQAFQTELPMYQCPSDESHDPESIQTTFTWTDQTRSNYVGCFSPHGFQVEPEANETCLINMAMNGGQKTTANPSVTSTSPFTTKPGRSIFNWFGKTRKFANVTDGTSNTVMVSEVVCGSDFDINRADFRGLWWLCQGVGYSHFRTPNNPQSDLRGDGPGSIDYITSKPNLPNIQVMPGGWPGWIVSARSRHPMGIVTTYVDGSVRFINDTIASSVWTAIGSMDGGETESY